MVTRRSLISIAVTAGLTGLLAGCSDSPDTAQNEAITQAPAENYEWKMVTSWPKNFPGLGTAAETFAVMVNEMSGGQLTVEVYGGGQLVPPLEVFDAVSSGTAELGHTASYYWKGKAPAAQFFAAVPFGLTAQEMNGWLHHGGGMALWQEVYEPFGLKPLAAGNTGVQMGGWFNKEINSVADLKGLKMRLPGLGGEVLRRAGGVPVNLPGGELFTALQTGAIDATEWVGPYNDLAFGLHKAAKYYYYPGWHEPGTTLELMVNQKAFDKLPKDLQKIVEVAARAANQDMLDEYTARNNAALKDLVEKHEVQLREFPQDVLAELKKFSDQVIAEEAKRDQLTQKVYDSFISYRDEAMNYSRISEKAYINAR